MRHQSVLGQDLAVFFSFFSVILSDQDNPLMLLSVLARPDLAQCLHRSRCVKLYVIAKSTKGSHPVFSSHQCVQGHLGGVHVCPVAVRSSPTLLSPRFLLADFQAQLLTHRTCGFKCDPDLYRGQGVKKGEEEEEGRGEPRNKGRRERKCVEKRD